MDMDGKSCRELLGHLHTHSTAWSRAYSPGEYEHRFVQLLASPLFCEVDSPDTKTATQPDVDIHTHTLTVCYRFITENCLMAVDLVLNIG